MAFLSLPTDTVPVSVEDGDGNTAVFRLKRWLSKRDVNHGLDVIVEKFNRLRTAGVVKDSDVPQEQRISNLELVLADPDGQLAILSRTIMSAEGLVDADGQALEWSIELVDNLRDDAVDALIAEIKRLNRVKTAEERLNLDNGSSPASTRATTSRRS